MKKLMIPILISFGLFFSCSKKEEIPKREIKGFELSSTMLKTTTFAKVEKKLGSEDKSTNSSENKTALFIPSKALIFNKNNWFVVVYKSQTDVKIKQIKILQHQRDTTYISGLGEGENVVVNNQLRIYRSLIN